MSQIQKISKNNTTVSLVDGAKVCALHATQIVTFWENARKVKLDTRGWFTATTRNRMTQCFREWGIPLSVGFTVKEGNRVRNYQTGQEYEFGQDNTLVVTY
jgi:hypothetical protein